MCAGQDRGVQHMTLQVLLCLALHYFFFAPGLVFAAHFHDYQRRLCSGSYIMFYSQHAQSMQVIYLVLAVA